MVHLALLYTEKAFSTNNFHEVMKMLSLTDYREFSSGDPGFNPYLDALKSETDKCSHCSADLAANARFCSACGAMIEPASIIGALLDDSIRRLSIADRIASRIEPEYRSVGDVIHAERAELMRIPHIKEVRSRMIKNAADEYISG